MCKVHQRLMIHHINTQQISFGSFSKAQAFLPFVFTSCQVWHFKRTPKLKNWFINLSKKLLITTVPKYKIGLHLKFWKIIENMHHLLLYKSDLVKYLCNCLKKFGNVWWLQKNTMTESNFTNWLYLTTFKWDSTFLWLLKI